jgi:hypothetical protein
VYARDRLRPGHRFAGPAIVEQLDTTTLVLPGQEVAVDDFGNLRVAIRSLGGDAAGGVEGLEAGARNEAGCQAVMDGAAASSSLDDTIVSQDS